jgi:hypothetical protein
MKKITTAGVTAVALSVVLVGCSPTTEKNSTATEQSTPTEQSVEARPEGATLHQYIVDNKIAEVPFKKGEAGTPTVDFPFPPGWRAAGDLTPDWAYGAIIYDKAVDANDPPFMYAIGSKLTGDIDPQKVLELAPAQLNELPGFKANGEPERDKLSGFDAIDYVGTYELDGKTRAVGQQTIVIPGEDSLFVLQLNGEAPAGQEQVVIDAVNLIGDQTKITLPS